eukprot:6441724-Prymnesium_polylepis.1
MLPPKSSSGQQCAFVLFKAIAAAHAAHAALHMQHKMLPTDDPIVVKFADSSGKRKSPQPVPPPANFVVSMGGAMPTGAAAPTPPRYSPTELAGAFD